MRTLLGEIEEEDISISLFSTFYQSEEDLRFFSEKDRKSVASILEKLSQDSLRHKKMLEEIVCELRKKIYEE